MFPITIQPSKSNSDKCFAIYGTVLGDTIALGLCLGFTLEQFEEAYYKKNKINWDRIANNY